jgi:AraC-like DNA-binding protein/mannose-6-phosphate isomerase-like protein (cupin superfamily)
MKENHIIRLHTHKGDIYADLKQNLEHFKNFSKHSHPTLSLCMIGEGEITIAYHPDTKVTLHPGQIALFCPDQVHLTRNLSDTPLPYYNLHFDKAWALTIQQKILDTQKLLPMNKPIISDVRYATELMDIITQINQDVLTQSETEVKITALLQRLFVHYADTQHIPEEAPLFDQIKQYILEHIDQEISATTIAAHTGYSTAHISRRFKQHFGLTLQAFLIDQRIHHAKALMLQHSNLSLAQIALEAGFYDQSHFIKNFKKAYSISPNAYKSPPKV